MSLVKCLAGAALCAAAVAAPASVFDDPFFADDPFFRPGFRRFCGGAADCWRISVRDTDKEFRLEMAMPGVPKEDIDISVKNDALSISVNRKECSKTEKDGECVSRRVFSRIVRLPSGTDKEKIKAAYKDGVLTLSVPKISEAENPERKIVIE